MKLEVGMYVRTKDGIIDKIIIDYYGHCANPNCKYKHISCTKNYYDEDKIVKASYNIIDILEVGDYVNGSKVIEIEKDYKFIDGTIRDILWTDTKMQRAIWDETIKSIITKEQMEQMTYKVG